MIVMGATQAKAAKMASIDKLKSSTSLMPTTWRPNWMAAPNC